MKFSVSSRLIPLDLVPWVAAAMERPYSDEAAEIFCRAKLESGAALASWVERDSRGDPLAFLWFDA